jgi:hypothetical protein
MPPSHASPRFVDRARVDDLLRPIVPDATDRAFVVRCVLDEGPAHHRGSNYVLLSLLGVLADRLGAPAPPEGQELAPVTMRVPPHLARSAPKHYPLSVPLAPLLGLAAGDRAVADEMVEVLIDGPPQHALANAAMVALLARLLEVVPGGAVPDGGAR